VANVAANRHILVNTLSADRTGTGQIYITGTGGVAHMG